MLRNSGENIQNEQDFEYGMEDDVYGDEDDKSEDDGERPRTGYTPQEQAAILKNLMKAGQKN